MQQSIRTSLTSRNSSSQIYPLLMRKGSENTSNDDFLLWKRIYDVDYDVYSEDV